jgi:dipeptidyl aminopeptidase/acylaminoacyl peptidase
MGGAVMRAAHGAFSRGRTSSNAWRKAFAGLALAIPGLVCIQTGARAAPLEAYGSLPTISDVALSPQGDMIAYATSDGVHNPILIYSFSEKKVVGGLNPGVQKVRNIRWAGEDRLLVTTSTTGRVQETDFISSRGEYSLTVVYRLSTHSQANLLGVAPNAMNISLQPPQVRMVGGRPVVYVVGVHFETMNEGHGMPALFAVDLENNATTFLASNKNARGWVIDDAGNVVSEEDYDDGARHWSLNLKRGHGSQEVFGVDAPIDTPEAEGLAADGQAILVRTLDAQGYFQRAFHVSDGSPAMTPTAEDEGVTFIHAPQSHRIIGETKIAEGFDTKFTAPDDEERWHAIVQAYPGAQVELVSSSDDKSKVVVRVTGPRDGVAYNLVDLNAGSTLPIGRMYAGVGADDLAPVKWISYAAADGRRISAYLTLPRGREAKDLPLIVLPHGGPESRDLPGFDWWSQALASRGYAVLQPQFRGSGGFGWSVLSAGFGEWGRKMQSDLSDGVRFLASDHTIDPKRLHRGCELWRLCGAGRRDARCGRLSLCGVGGGDFRSAHVHRVGGGPAAQSGQSGLALPLPLPGRGRKRRPEAG